MLWIVYLACPLMGFVGYFLGKWTGKKRTVALFHELQDDGELIVLTRAQYEAGEGQKLLHSDPTNGEDDLDEVSYKRRDSSERRIDWAGSIRQSEQYGTTEEIEDDEH